MTAASAATVGALERAQTKRNLEAVLCELAPRFGERLSTAEIVREHHGRDVSYLPACPPDAVKSWLGKSAQLG
jgi:hypothetical protein